MKIIDDKKTVYLVILLLCSTADKHGGWPLLLHYHIVGVHVELCTYLHIWIFPAWFINLTASDKAF